MFRRFVVLSTGVVIGAALVACTAGTLSPNVPDVPEVAPLSLSIPEVPEVAPAPTETPTPVVETVPEVAPVGESVPTPVESAPTPEVTPWPTSGIATFEDGSWRNMDTGESGCTPGALCDDTYLPTYTLPPCQYEDSENCYWDASRMGNGVGTSFIRLNGVSYVAQ